MYFSMAILREGGYKNLMGRKTKKKIIYTDEPMQIGKIVKDFLPPPDQLIFKEDQVKVTLSLNKSSVDFFKKQAQKNHTQYQKMIRKLLDFYVSSQRSL